MKYEKILTYNNNVLNVDSKPISKKPKLVIDTRNNDGTFSGIRLYEIVGGVPQNPVSYGGKLITEIDIPEYISDGYYIVRLDDKGIFHPYSFGDAYVRIVCEEPLIRSLYYMFNNIGGYYGEIDLKRLNTSNVTNMSYFMTNVGTPSYKLDLSNFDTRKVTTFKSMFVNMTFDDLYLSNFTINPGADTDKMFGDGDFVSSIGYIHVDNCDEYTINSMLEQLNRSGQKYTYNNSSKCIERD